MKMKTYSRFYSLQSIIINWPVFLPKIQGVEVPAMFARRFLGSKSRPVLRLIFIEVVCNSSGNTDTEFARVK